MATVNIAYSASAALTITLASLATSSTKLVGRDSTAISNSTNKYDDVLVSGKVTTGTSPTAGQIEVWAYAALDDTPTYADGVDGTDSAATITSDGIKFGYLRLIASLETSATSDVAYPFPPTSLVELFGGMPRDWGVFVTHNTAVNLNSTAGNHFIKYQGLTYTVA